MICRLRYPGLKTTTGFVELQRSQRGIKSCIAGKRAPRLSFSDFDMPIQKLQGLPRRDNSTSKNACLSSVLPWLRTLLGLYRMSLGLWTGWLNSLDTKVNAFVFNKLPVTVTVTSLDPCLNVLSNAKLKVPQQRPVISGIRAHKWRKYVQLYKLLFNTHKKCGRRHLTRTIRTWRKPWIRASELFSVFTLPA